jgi:hypothetical protein
MSARRRGRGQGRRAPLTRLQRALYDACVRAATDTGTRLRLVEEKARALRASRRDADRVRERLAAGHVHECGG